MLTLLLLHLCMLTVSGLQPKDVDIIVTTCSIFCPTPSLTSMVVNHFGMRTDVQSYHLGGMGCSNGVVAVNLINDLLKVGSASTEEGGYTAHAACRAGLQKCTHSACTTAFAGRWPGCQHYFKGTTPGHAHTA